MNTNIYGDFKISISVPLNLTATLSFEPRFRICDAPRNFVAFAQFKKRKTTHERVLILVKL